MKPKASGLLLIAAIILFGLVGLTGYAQKESAPTGRTVWEYKTLKSNRALTEETLNDMGMYGWEFVTFDTGDRGNGSFGGTYYFKRPK